jgi:hypothetical protein
VKNLIAELLVKLAQKEEEAKELTVQVEALEVVVTALLRHMEQDAQQALIHDIEQAIERRAPVRWWTTAMPAAAAIYKEAVTASS